MAEYFREKKERAYDKRTVSIKRVAKVTKGGKRLRFSAMVVVGDHNGSVGVGLGRGVDTKSAVEKGERIATKKLTKIQLAGDTIPHEVDYKFGAVKLLLRPARPGTGVIAGSSVRTVLELAGVDNVYGKILGSSNSNGNAYCTFKALKALRSERVLSRMQKMRDRIVLKEETEKERRAKEEKRRKKEMEKKKTQKKNRFEKIDRRKASAKAEGKKENKVSKK